MLSPATGSEHGPWPMSLEQWMKDSPGGHLLWASATGRTGSGSNMLIVCDKNTVASGKCRYYSVKTGAASL